MSFDMRKEDVIHRLNQQIKYMEDMIDEIDYCDNDVELIMTIVKYTKKVETFNKGREKDARLGKKE